MLQEFSLPRVHRKPEVCGRTLFSTGPSPPAPSGRSYDNSRAQTCDDHGAGAWEAKRYSHQLMDLSLSAWNPSAFCSNCMDIPTSWPHLRHHPPCRALVGCRSPAPSLTRNIPPMTSHPGEGGDRGCCARTSRKAISTGSRRSSLNIPLIPSFLPPLLLSSLSHAELPQEPPLDDQPHAPADALLVR